MKKNKYICIFIFTFSILNALFIFLEIYKENIRNMWENNKLPPEVAFNKLEYINNWTDGIVFFLTVSLIISAVWIILKKKDYLMTIIIVTTIIQLIFLSVSFLISSIINISVFNLIQQLLGQIFVTIILFLFYLSNLSLNKYNKNKGYNEPKVTK